MCQVSRRARHATCTRLYDGPFFVGWRKSPEYTERLGQETGRNKRGSIRRLAAGSEEVRPLEIRESVDQLARGSAQARPLEISECVDQQPVRRRRKQPLETSDFVDQQPPRSSELQHVSHESIPSYRMSRVSNRQRAKGFRPRVVTQTKCDSEKALHTRPDCSSPYTSPKRQRGEGKHASAAQHFRRAGEKSASPCSRFGLVWSTQ